MAMKRKERSAPRRDKKPELTSANMTLNRAPAQEASSVANSSSENRDAADVHVNTDERFRGRGHALDVVASWVEHIQTAGKQAFYSHKATNASSARVAEKMGFEKVFDDIRLLKLGNNPP